MNGKSGPAMTVEEYMAIPFILEIWSKQQQDGQWVRHAEYPELPGCAAESFSAVEAVEKAEEARVAYILRCLERGEEIPVPRRPLRA
ncbi:type II toxin-antitoxin system HicB family antitoxin [Alicyclobacillus dauci]|uniref:Type II toxin-antitoxin system HicB family antitoxin n=1 Tax=Alicyclobacillus dauci TaxID=1475485 RepID=A0ABY6YYN3_9BACL|nr:hypothetical protein [Alicyclobacillus dauci]WAH35686.1 type II toxin-antitoxin system HicB family antitoxin [Alicyclobacillus dauci]